MSNDERAIQEVINRIGIHGVLAILHDAFGEDRNAYKHKQWPSIQEKLRRCDKDISELTQGTEP